MGILVVARNLDLLRRKLFAKRVSHCRPSTSLLPSSSAHEILHAFLRSLPHSARNQQEPWRWGKASPANTQESSLQYQKKLPKGVKAHRRSLSWSCCWSRSWTGGVGRCTGQSTPHSQGASRPSVPSAAVHYSHSLLFVGNHCWAR